MSKRNNGFSYKDGVSLKEYFDTKMEGVKQATEIIRVDLERRLEGMNEFRTQLEKQAASFITRTEHDFLIERIAEIKEELNKRPTWLMTFVFMVMSVMFGLLVTKFLT